MNTPVSFEIAKLLKEKGFDKQLNYYYDSFGDIGSSNIKVNWNNSEELLCSAPTITEVVMWLYSKYAYSLEHSMNIPESGEHDGCYVFNGLVKGSEDYKLRTYFVSNNMPNIPKAYEAAIEYTLKNLV